VAVNLQQCLFFLCQGSTSTQQQSIGCGMQRSGSAAAPTAY
jgi:hypothetical protein